MWTKVREIALADLAPKIFKSVAFEPSSSSGQVGALATLTYCDGAKWKILISEISDKNFTIGYEVMETDPAINVTSIQGEIKLRPVTDADQTFLEWTTEYSNDVDLQVIEDQKFKKRDFFKAVKSKI